MKHARFMRAVPFSMYDSMVDFDISYISDYRGYELKLISRDLDDQYMSLNYCHRDKKKYICNYMLMKRKNMHLGKRSLRAISTNINSKLSLIRDAHYE